MNPRVAANRPERHRASAALLAGAALIFFGAPATAGCGSSDHRPALPLGMAEVETATPPDPVPACSGPSCSRDKAPLPISPTVTIAPRLDPCDGSSTVPTAETLRPCPIGRHRDLIPIGRVTDVDRPPSTLA